MAALRALVAQVAPGQEDHAAAPSRKEMAATSVIAGDLDEETLVRYLDRFLMYYIRTADRLQRTAAWIDALDGGLDRVREVVVDDVLGLGAELEEAMARHVGAYEDEWRATLDDPDKLARFTSFVNAPDTPDPTIEFVDHPHPNGGSRRVPAGMKDGEPTDLAALGTGGVPITDGARIPMGAPA